MNVHNKNAPLILFTGDLIVFVISLWLTLAIRYGETPSRDLFYSHLAPFSFLFVIWFLVYFIAGLYDQRTIILRQNIYRTLLNAQVINSLIAIAFFYLIPYFGITPKTNLFIYLLVLYILIVIWRRYGDIVFGARSRQNALLISSGDEMRELKEEVNANSQYNLKFISSLDLDAIDGIDFKEEILNRVYAENVSVIAVDFNNEKVEPILPHLYNLVFSNIIFVDMHKVYEDVFGRVPLSLIKYSWFLENISLAPKASYDLLKRAMDTVVAIILGIISLIVYPFVWIVIKLDDGGPLFIRQERIGKNGTPITIYKFRTMARNEVDLKQGGNAVTRVGSFLRKTRIDELPQLWSVIRGDTSLIGPRPELPSGVKVYEQEIPYYNIRHLIKPGLSGWAQIYHENHPHHGMAVSETREKLSYDLYYIKNRSFILDIKIALKTIKEMLSRRGR
jgi:exopolysaccharide biosynthesis polyprenyl glycosylphosphotransferase